MGPSTLFGYKNLGPPHISEATMSYSNLKSYMLLDGGKYSFQVWNFFARGGEGRSVPSVNFGPPHILETTRARKFKFYMYLDGAKYLYLRGEWSHLEPPTNFDSAVHMYRASVW